MLSQNVEKLSHSLLIINSCLFASHDSVYICSCILCILSNRDVMDEVLEVPECFCWSKWYFQQGGMSYLPYKDYLIIFTFGDPQVSIKVVDVYFDELIGVEEAINQFFVQQK